MTDIVTRVRAAIEATEQDARDASGRSDTWGLAEPPEAGWWKDPHDDEIVAGGKPIIRLNEDYGGNLAGPHIVRWDPQTVLRGCAADRRTLHRHRAQNEGGVLPWLGCAWCSSDDRPMRFPCPDIEDLAERHGVRP